MVEPVKEVYLFKERGMQVRVLCKVVIEEGGATPLATDDEEVWEDPLASAEAAETDGYLVLYTLGFL
jgi:hypothetical protein